jgi:hypothetical protein
LLRGQRRNQSENLLSALESMQAVDQEFNYEVGRDGNSLLWAFWSTASQRRNYSKFLQLVEFDSTYKTNRLELPLGKGIFII